MTPSLRLRPRSILSLLVAATALLAACGGAESPPGSGTGGALGSGAATSSGDSSSSSNSGGASSSSTGGVGGEAAVSPSAKPTCEDPNPVTGGTPNPRADTAGALSADGHGFVLFGGDTALPVCGQTPKHTHAGDTWLLDTACGGWTDVSSMSTTAPAARARHAMALDAPRSRALLFGGRTRAGSSGPYTLFNDLWAFDFTKKTWSEVVTTGTGPTARYNAAIAAVGDKLLVFGGSTDTTGLSFLPTNDTYALDLATSTWSVITTSGGPPPARLFHALAASPSGSTAYVYAGGDKNAFTGPFLKDLWVLNLGQATWTKIMTVAGDTDGAGRIKFGLTARLVPDAAPELFAFGGHDDGALGNRNDVITISTLGSQPQWSTVRAGDVINKMPSAQCDFPADFTKQDAESPERRSAFAFGASQGGDSFVVVSGDSDCGRLSDAWWFDTNTKLWMKIRGSLPGLTCQRTGNTMCSSLCN